MAYNFRPVNRDQLYLLPPSLRDWLPEDHLAWFLIDAVEQMDLRAFYESTVPTAGAARATTPP